jgi:hypothetical protein
MTKQMSVPTEEAQGQTQFYLIFDEMAKACTEDDVLMNEIDEIEQISRVVENITEENEQPCFMTST